MEAQSTPSMNRDKALYQVSAMFTDKYYSNAYVCYFLKSYILPLTQLHNVLYTIN